MTKPDCTGQRFGRLIVLGKGSKYFYPNSSCVQLWKLQCDCGNVIEKPRADFEKKGQVSCGCARSEANRIRSALRRKPDCTGQRFGRLVVLGGGGKRPRRNSYIQLWRLQCDCGNVIEKPRDDFEKKGQVSCGCKRRLGLVSRRPKNIAGLKFGSLRAIALTGERDTQGKPTWLMQCDCGNFRKLSLSRIRASLTQGLRINCGNREKHSDRYLEYPETPSPYPIEAGELLKKYLHLTELPYTQVDSRVEDAKRDRLLRACWIITYRRQQGEDISELYERRYIRKWLRYSSVDVFWRRKLEEHGGFLYDVENNKKEIGTQMANVTSENYPLIETSGTNIMPIPPKRFKFKQC